MPTKKGQRDLYVESGSQDLNAGALDYSTKTGMEWKLVGVLMYFSNKIKRDITLSIVKEGGVSTIWKFYQQEEAQDIILNNQFPLSKEFELNISIPQTVGGPVITFEIIKEAI